MCLQDRLAEVLSPEHIDRRCGRRGRLSGRTAVPQQPPSIPQDGASIMAGVEGAGDDKAMDFNWDEGSITEGQPAALMPEPGVLQEGACGAAAGALWARTLSMQPHVQTLRM